MANNGAREERTVDIQKGYDAHTARAFTPKSVTQDTPSGVVAGLDNRGTSYVPKGAGDSKGGKD